MHQSILSSLLNRAPECFTSKLQHSNAMLRFDLSFSLLTEVPSVSQKLSLLCQETLGLGCDRRSLVVSSRLEFSSPSKIECAAFSATRKGTTLLEVGALCLHELAILCFSCKRKTFIRDSQGRDSQLHLDGHIWNFCGPDCFLCWFPKVHVAIMHVQM